MGYIELLSDRLSSSHGLQIDKIFNCKAINDLTFEEIGRILKLPNQEEVLNILLVYCNTKYERLDPNDREELINLIFSSDMYSKFIESCKSFCIKDLDYGKTMMVISFIQKTTEGFQAGYIRRVAELTNINGSSIFTSLIGLFIKIEDKDICMKLYDELYDLDEEESEQQLTYIFNKYSNSINKVKIKTLKDIKGKRLRR